MSQFPEPAPLKSLHTPERVQGLTHSFYRYPAATSPRLFGEIMRRFTRSDDYVMDPFMGGGTTIVEALAAGRRAVGFDINSVSLFVAAVKTRPLYPADWKAIETWQASEPLLRCGGIGELSDERALNLPPALRDPIASALRSLHELDTNPQRQLVRCALLRMAQWAIEAKDEVPSPEGLSGKLGAVLAMYRSGMEDFVNTARDSGILKSEIVGRRHLLNTPAQDAIFESTLRPLLGRVRFVLTSPPYPGVHVLYHRWQVKSRKETPAPYWITNCTDGAGPSYYTMGSRTPLGERNYFENLEQAYRALRPFLSDDALIVQLVAFNQASRQLPLFLEAMTRAGYAEDHELGHTDPLIRVVPNRRWYARGRTNDASREYIIAHRIA